MFLLYLLCFALRHMHDEADEVVTRARTGSLPICAVSYRVQIGGIQREGDTRQRVTSYNLTVHASDRSVECSAPGVVLTLAPQKDNAASSHRNPAIN